MSYIIVDLEFNNMKDITTYDKNFYEKYKQLENIEIQNEIIEIGAVKLDERMKKIGSMKVYIKPTIFPIINPIVNEITKIDMKLLKEQGVEFKEAINKLNDMFEDNDILCSWAKDDIVELIFNSRYHNNYNLKFSNKYLDLQEYVTKVLGYKKVLGLKNILKKLNVKSDDSRFHDALYDAECTVEVFKRLYNCKIIKNYIVHDIYDMPALIISNQYADIDENFLKLECPKCRIKIDLSCEIRRLTWRFIGVGICPKCKNNILCEIIVKKSLNENITYSEIGSILNDEVYEKYCYKLNNMKNKEENN